MRTEFGELTVDAVMAQIDEYRRMGRAAFLAEYANRRDSKSTWISFEGELYPAKAIYASALNPRRMPAEFNTSHTYIFSQGLGLELVRIEDGFVRTQRSALDDLDELNVPGLPERREFSGERFVRDPKIRAAVLKRAQGHCEHCGEEGFPMKSGLKYLEAHHILSLANQGPDSMDNVIALCPRDHRRAHYATDSAELEGAFQRKLASMKS